MAQTGCEVQLQHVEAVVEQAIPVLHQQAICLPPFFNADLDGHRALNVFYDSRCNESLQLPWT